MTYGTKIRRRLNENCWIDKFQKIEKELVMAGLRFITDVRFENEIDWIQSLDGKTIHIERNGTLPPNEEEAKNDPILRNKSTLIIDG